VQALWSWFFLLIFDPLFFGRFFNTDGARNDETPPFPLSFFSLFAPEVSAGILLQPRDPDTVEALSLNVCLPLFPARSGEAALALFRPWLSLL